MLPTYEAEGEALYQAIVEANQGIVAKKADALYYADEHKLGSK